MRELSLVSFCDREVTMVRYKLQTQRKRKFKFTSHKFQALEIYTSRYIAHRQISETYRYHSASCISLDEIIFAIKSGVIFQLSSVIPRNVVSLTAWSCLFN